MGTVFVMGVNGISSLPLILQLIISYENVDLSSFGIVRKKDNTYFENVCMILIALLLSSNYKKNLLKVAFVI